jgi:transcriptional antiterminator
VKEYNLTSRQMIIINSIYKKNTLTAQELSLILDVSIRTVKYEIKEIRENLASCSLGGISSGKKGYTLEVNDGDFAEYLKALDTSKKLRVIDKFRSNRYKRVFYILEKLLTEGNYIKYEDLIHEMYVSKSSLNIDIKEVKRLIRKYHLYLVSKPNYGIIIEGEELNKRLCISEYIFHNETILDEHYTKYDKKDIRSLQTKVTKIEQILRESAKKYEIILSDFSFNNIAIHIYVLIVRNSKGFFIEFNQEYINSIDNSTTMLAVDKIVNELQDVFNIAVTPMESAYIYTHIDSKKIISEEYIDGTSKDINVLLDKITFEIFNNFDIDISKEYTLRKYLKLHIPQMVKRINNNLIVRNPVIHESLRKYLYATKVTVSAVYIIEEFYDVDIPLDEFGYLVYYFNMGLFNQKKKKKFKIGFINSLSRSESIMYTNELNTRFPDTKIFNFKSETEAEMHDENIDLLVSSNHINNKKFKANISINEGSYIEKIEEYIKKRDLYDLPLNKYFNESYLVTGIKGESRKDILNQVYNTLSELDIVDESKVIDYPFIAHEIGNRVVNLQDLHKLCRKSVCIVIVLEKPILWEKSIVEILFLIKTKKDGDKDLFILCDLFSKYTSNKDKIKKLINNKDYNQFMKDLLDYQ